MLGKQEQKLLREQEKEKIWQKFLKDYKGTEIEKAAELLRNIVKDSDSQELAEWDRALRLEQRCIIICHIAKVISCIWLYLQPC